MLATAINQYCYVMLHDGKSWKTYDLPTEAGLGSSSAYTVGLLRACTSYDNVTIARLATTWEQDKMGGNVGAQDQYICALGGFRVFRFSRHGVSDKLIDPGITKPLQGYTMLFNTHQYRRASMLVAYQMAEMKRHKKLYERITQMVDEGYNLIDEVDWGGLGILLDESWQIKKQLSKHISTLRIDDIYDRAIQAGAIGGKLLGGGGGGFIVFIVAPEKQSAVKKALSELDYVPFQFEQEGTQVIYHDD